jgi:diguanylate cyclase (GGDEF)-like protein
MGVATNPRGDTLRALPEGSARDIRTASVEPYVSVMFAHLPQLLELEAEVPTAPGALPLAARQLLKLALGGTQLRLSRATPAAGAGLRITVRAGSRQRVLGREDLEQDLQVVAEQILESLCDQDDFLHILEVFAFQSANLATLQTIISHMLQSTDVDQALHAMLSGITSGQGLGFNRAALFIHSPERRTFVGAKAIGPADAREASRIWEEMEYQELSIDRLVQDYAPAQFDTPFQRFVQQLELRPGGPGDEVARALDPHPPLLFHDPPRNPTLARLTESGDFVLGAVRPHGRTLGLIFADNLYSQARITPGRLHYFDFFVDQTALVWENLELLKRVEALARYDSLTGLLNRREFEARFQAERSRSQRSGDPCSLLLLDLDLFKQVNDRLGHEAGDAVLRQLGAVLQQAVRSHDHLGRFGGDEFVILLPDTTPEQLAQAAIRVGAKAWHHDISVSIGGATWPVDCSDVTQLFGVADRNLYRAKHAGRGRACLGNRPPLLLAGGEAGGTTPEP